MKLFFVSPLKYLWIWGQTSLHPMKYSKSDRREISRGIKALAKKSGISPRKPMKTEFIKSSIIDSPATGGVYFGIRQMK